MTDILRLVTGTLQILSTLTACYLIRISLAKYFGKPFLDRDFPKFKYSNRPDVTRFSIFGPTNEAAASRLLIYYCQIHPFLCQLIFF